MFSKLNRALSRILGASDPADSVDCYLSDVRNDSAKDMVMDTTVCMTPEIEEGTRLTFKLSPLLRNNDGEGWNVLGHLRNKLNLENGERIVVMKISRLHLHNELDGDFRFVMEHPFDVEAETQRIRSRMDMLLATDDKETTILPSSNGKAKVIKSGGGGNNNNVSTAVDASSDAEMDPSVRALFDLAPSGPNQQQRAPAGSITIDEETARQLDSITIRGSRVYRNRAETSNSIDLGIIKGNTTVYYDDEDAESPLYRASVSFNIVKWFAGQDQFVMEDPCQVLKRVNTEDTDPDVRARKPIINYLVYPEDHSLILFINMFADDLGKKPHEMRPLKTERETGLRGAGTAATETLYQVDRDLVDRARKMILYIVYAQIYYTTLRDCRLVRHVESEEQEFALLHRIASDWGLHVDPQTKHVSDWAPGQYRPQIVVTLRISYFLIRSVTNSAAALHKERVLLSAK